MKNITKRYIFLLAMFTGILVDSTIYSMQSNATKEILHFIQENVEKPSFEGILERFQNPESSLIFYCTILKYAKDVLYSPKFSPMYFSRLPEGSFKLAMRLIYAKNNPKKYLDDVNVGAILERLSRDYDLKEGYLNLERCHIRMKNFNEHLKYLLPLLEPLAETGIIWLRLSKNGLTNLPPSICCLGKIQKLYINDNQLNDLPDHIRYLSKLSYIDISQNRFTAIPSNIKHIPTIYFPVHRQRQPHAI